MKHLLRRIRAALLMGLTWALVWSPLGVLIGMIVDRDGIMDEPWILVGAYPGFFSGIVFSVILGIAARHRKFSELSVTRFASWGALAGLALGVVPFLAGTPNPSLPIWFPGVVVGSIALLGAASAAGSLALARRAERRGLAAGTTDPIRLSDARPADT